jgi:iron complex transport system substrate-binding protein
LLCVLIIALLLQVVGLSACDQKPVNMQQSQQTPQKSQPADTSITLTDLKGRTVTLEGPATRVIATAPGDCEIIHALGAGDALVGRGEYCNYPSQVQDLPSVETGSSTNIEQIISLDPQLVIMNTMAQASEHASQLEQAGIAVIATEATTIDGVYQAIEVIGKALGVDAAAASLVQELKDGFDDLSATPVSEAATIYFEVSPLEYGLWTAGADTFMEEIANILGLTNIFADVAGWAEVSQEQVIDRNPDYIVTITMYMGTGPTPDVEIAARPGWEQITAVRDGNILNLDSDAISRPGPRLLDAARELAAAVSG